VRSGTAWPGTWRLARYAKLSARLRLGKVKRGADRAERDAWSAQERMATLVLVSIELGPFLTD
jgi:hypothetical protein